MSTVTASRSITPDEAASALLGRLGDRYQITPDGTSALIVKHGLLASARVQVTRAGDATTFRVHGRGLIIGRLAKGLGIARTVASAIRAEYGSAA